MGVVREVTRDQLHNVLPLNVNVKKSNDKLRLIFNAMFINDYMSIPKFKYPQLNREGREIFGESSHAYAIDISQAFYHIEIDPGFHKFLGFFWEGKFYCWQMMPFGVSFGPWLFDRVLTPVVDKLKKDGLRLMTFCDDIMGGNKPQSRASEDSLRLKTFLQLHGYIVQESKCQGVGNALSVIVGLGLKIDCCQQKYFMTEKRQQQIISISSKLLSSSHLRARQLAQLAGLIMSQIAALGPMVRIRTRSIYSNIKTCFHDNVGQFSTRSTDYDLLISINDDTRLEITFWSRNITQYNWQCIAYIFPVMSFHCKTASDASDSGYGGFLQIPRTPIRNLANRILKNSLSLLGSYSSVTCTQLQQGLDVWGAFTPAQSRKSSTWRELFGAGKIFEIFGSLLSGCTVPLYLDSQVAVMNLGGELPSLYPGKVFGGSKKEDLQKLVVWIFDIAGKHNFGIRATWIPRELNERSDFNSHLNEYNHYDFSLKTEIFSIVEKQFGPHTVDRFASDISAQLPCYNTKFFSPRATGLDAFALDWGNGENNYAFPPPSMVGQVLPYARQRRFSLTLIYLEWYSRPYMSFLGSRGENPFLLDRIPLGHSFHVLEYRSHDADSRLHHLSNGQVWAVRLDFSLNS